MIGNFQVSEVVLYCTMCLHALLFSDFHDYILNYTTEQPFSMLSTSLRGHNFHVARGMGIQAVSELHCINSVTVL